MKPIGIVRSPFRGLEQMPIQSSGAAGIQGRVIVDPEYQPGLVDLELFSHIYLIYRFHLSEGFSLSVTPFLDDRPHGVFSTRAPRRPNPIGLSIVRLTGIEENVIKIEGVDILDRTPLLDIKPYIDKFDRVDAAGNGWLTAGDEEIRRTRSDQRFIT